MSVPAARGLEARGSRDTIAPVRRIASRFAALTSLVVIALLACGCGGGDDSSSTVTQTGTEDLNPDATAFLGAALAASTAGEPGVVVLEVAPDSSSRLKVGDVVIACNGKPIATPDELHECGGGVEVGEQFTIRVIRGSKRFTLAEVLSPSAFLGVEVKDASGERGARVMSVAPGSPAADAGFEKDDLITALDETRVTDGDSLVAAVGTHAAGDEVTVAVVRGSKDLELSVTLVRNPATAG
jgi:S1-C subfamily serine protease